ncbi:MAG TPA: oligosaccharide flippase family protein [Candidatus Krumholzibacteria bacterium]|nr:oligosaccharide flippase family protein [Candidatus Krumholzibacteria bacterium]
MATVTAQPLESPRMFGGDPVRRQLRGSSLLLLGRFLSRGINFFSQLLIVHTLTTQSFGAFAYGLAVVAFWDGLSSFGLNKSITRFVPIYHERGDHARVRGAILLVLAGIACTSLIAIATVYLAPGLLSRMVRERGPLDLLLILIFLVPVDALDEFLLGLFACFARPKAIFFRKHVLAPSLKLGVVVLLVLLHADAHFLARGYVTASIVGVSIYSLLFLRLFRRQGLLGARGDGVSIPAREMFAFTLPLLSTNLVPMVMHSIATLILGYYHQSTEVAMYRVVLPAAQLNNIVVASFGILFTPIAARLFARGDREGMRALYWRSTVWMAVLSFPVFALTFSCARGLTTTLYGDRYASSWPILQMVSGAYYFSAALGNNDLPLRVVGKLRYIVTINVLAILASIVLTFALVPRFGAMGTGIATAGALLLHNVLKQWGLRAAGIGFFEWRYLPVYIVIVIGALGLFLAQLVIDNFFILLPAAALVSFLVLAFTKHELAIKDTFPELLKLPIVGAFLRAENPVQPWRSR